MASNISWEELSPQMRVRCNDSLVSRRVPFLKDLQQLIISHSLEPQQLDEISSILLETHMIYFDSKSKGIVASIFENLLTVKPELLTQYTSYIMNLVSKNPGSKAIVGYMNLLEWVNNFLEISSRERAQFESNVCHLLQAHSYITASIELALNNQESSKPSIKERNQHRNRMRCSALQLTTKSLVKCFKNKENSVLYVNLLSKIISQEYTNLKLPSSGVILLMSAISQATSQLLPSQPALYNDLKTNYIDTYCEYIGKEVILGKTVPTAFCLEVFLAPFLKEYVDDELFRKHFLPSIEKANLRSSEIGFTICSEFFSAIDNTKVDLLEIFTSSKIMTQCFSTFKSSKDTTRNIGLTAILALLSSASKKSTDSNSLNLLVDEIFKNVKVNLNAEYKTLSAKILRKIPSSSKETSLKIVKGLSPYISKESNEVAISYMLDAFFKHYFSLESHDENVDKIIANGFKDKKAIIKRTWFSSFLHNYSFQKQECSSLFQEECLEFIKEALSGSQRNDHYVLLACLSYIDYVWSFGSAESYTNILDLVKSLPHDSTFGDAFVLTSLSTSLEMSDRLRAVDLLKECFIKEPGFIGNAVIGSLEKVINSNDNIALENIAIKFSTQVLNAISQSIDDVSILRKVLVEEILISQSKQFNLKNGWAGLVLCAGQDPSNIVEEYADKIIYKMVTVAQNAAQENSALYVCALKALAYVAFINPSVVSPILSESIKINLNSDELNKLTSQDFDIWKGDEGVLVVDILEKKSVNKLSDKNTKDYETLKWEQSIRKEQAKKNVKRYTKDEQEIINNQLAVESKVRNTINKLYNRLLQTIETINYLVDDALLVDNGSSFWFPIAVSKLLALAKEKNAPLLLKHRVSDAFLKLSKVSSDRLGAYRFFIGLATLRVHQISAIPENFIEEPLSDLLSRVLFRIKFVSQQTSLNSLTLTYLLPLLISVLEEGKKVAIKNSEKHVARTEFVEEDKEEEHLLLAMEILAAHAEVFEDPSIPRVPILGVLLSLLGLASKAKLAKDCFNALCQTISVSPTKPDLSIILDGLLSSNPFVRSTVLEALDNEFELESFMNYSPEVFISRFDSDASHREVADFIWEFNKFEVNEGLLSDLYYFFHQDDSGLRLFTARAFASAATYLEMENNGSLTKQVSTLMDYYREKAKPLEPILDEFGLVVVSASERKDPWQERSTSALILKEVAIKLPKEDTYVYDIIKFLIEDGPLEDREMLVRQEMKEAGIEIIDLHGSNHSEELIPLFEASLTSNITTTVRENVIILYGCLARHLQSNDERITTIINRLLATLDTPSSDVQQAIAECISPLVFQFRKKVEAYLSTLMEKLLTPTVPLEVRKGAAWGVAGLVKGYGISALSEFDIIRNLIEAAEDKKEANRRESVAFAFEYLSRSLKEYFEPYVIEVLPTILKNLGDSIPEVREATAEATKAIMGYTTSYGITKLIPVAVSNLDDISWRTKRGSVQLLGNMAYLDPAQLSASLSSIVPQIVSVLNDSHKEVRKSADESLKRFGEVIRNPEIQKLVPTLIKAIGDPTKYTEEALDALIQTQFVHYIDGPSLALIIHVIHRGMHDRSANTKRKACKIVGNMAILVDTRDLIPYLQQLIEEVEVAMVDPVPNTRATAARALGALVERLGEDEFPDLIPRLLNTLSDESKSGDRLGSAQALAEVISGLGLSKLEELLPSILSGVANRRSYVREGFMPLLLYLPICFGAQFAPYINQIIQPILAGLADADENIRDTALKAGKLIVKNFATKAIDLLLPELEKGMFDENERIRLSSVQLSGELLFQVTGISSKNEFSEEAEHHVEFSNTMVEVLGQERRDRILSALFVCRNDTSGIVRANTVDIWKALVPNTPRAVKEILPTLTTMIVANLASSSTVLRNIAAQTLGDLVRRVGGNALSQLLPTLDESLKGSSSSDSRQGVCIALHELIESASQDSLAEFQNIIVNIIRKTLVDSDETVRQAAALSFDSYQSIVGKTAVDEIIPYLLHMLESSENSEHALLGLEDIMSTKSDVIFPILIPSLLSPPIDSFRASALGSLAAVAGSALYKRLPVIINSLVNSMITDDSEERTAALELALDKVFLSVTEEAGLHPLLQQIMSLLKSDDHKKRVVILERLPTFFDNTVLEFDLYVPDFVSHAILSLDDKDSRIVKANYEALATLIKKQDKATLERLVKTAKDTLHLVGTQGEDLAAFTLPKGPNCVLPIFLHGLMYGSSDEREAAALGIADVVSKTPAANLKPFVSAITGPLIRVVGERFNSDIKAAILFALNILFVKIPQFLRPFIPQLQRTFVKSLSDASNETLRLRAAKALGTLIEYQPRVDPLVTELVAGAKQTTDEGVKTAMLKALLEVVAKAGSKLNENSKTSIVNLVEEEMLSSNDKLAIAYAKLIGSLAEILSNEEAMKILREKVLNVTLDGDSGKFSILTLNSFLKDAPQHVLASELRDSFISYIVDAIDSPDRYFSENAVIAAGKVLLLQNEIKSPYSKIESEGKFEIGEDNIKQLIETLSRSMVRPNCNSTDTRRLSLVVVRTAARFKFDECVKPYYDLLGLSIFSCLRDPVIPIKLAAEKAYLAVFNLVEDSEMAKFNAWFNALSEKNTSNSLENVVGDVIQLRSVGDYTKRVGKRLASVERERIAAGGDAEAMFSDRFEDEREIWAVGGVELSDEQL
ncbi:hypothetical protein KAFR_0C02900 [Kazachstania africana CBS 2517]|uniref:eIF-2-alpha kinase activator GCN1 n=1 Tax=Kazachstania africana (strain ATCC 22294 / BCRC 22015 / CBS 2517 / CECT 1963 / NBRC 1671 / NRRL Y-8276) TaxID=1071382 RepID=H2ASD3_KAZAF|nr:hypothetical protein KAFR_0C02900 [Kazachstania africana CBS 2517]CCF57283.1 hypothetical protein KAFR_0C02900 [Kazachstania africana CBS 2517]